MNLINEVQITENIMNIKTIQHKCKIHSRFKYEFTLGEWMQDLALEKRLLKKSNSVYFCYKICNLPVRNKYQRQ